MSDKSTDTEYEDHVITKVSGNAKDGWEIMCGSLCFFPGKTPIKPKSGMVARFYGRGFGSPVRGLDIDGHECFYRTPHQQEQKHKADCEESNRKRRQEFELNRARYDQKYDALPAVFRDRIDRFRANCPTFRWEYEGYEVFCCEQAVLIADALQTPTAIEIFTCMDWKEQIAAVPGLSDGHSGNTFGCACGLAKLYIEHPEFVAKAMGAMVPVVGSLAYGDV